jgi:peptide/nickel transport system permease protein
VTALSRTRIATSTITGAFSRVWRTSRKFRIGFTIFVALLCLGAFSITTPSYYKNWYYFRKDTPPQLTSLDFLLGITTNGRSVFWILVNAIINSLAIAAVTTLIAAHLGLFIGMVAGIRGGWVDKVLMFVTDTFVTIPGFPLLYVMSMVLRPILTMPLLGLLISLTSWPWPARQVRAIVLSLRERDYITVARLSGMGTGKILASEIFPHLLGWHLINSTNTVLYSIGSEAGLAILGLSILQEDTLGTMIYWCQHYGALYRGIWWWIAPPIIALILLFISLYLISAGLQEYFNPRLRG